MRCKLPVSLAALFCAHAGYAKDVRPAATVASRLCASNGKAFSRFELTVLGSGGPRGFGRAASSYAIFIDGTARILVDAGPGAFVRLGEMDLDFTSLDTLLLTHLHIDHTGDVPGFVKSRDLAGEGPLMTFRFFGPAGGGDYPSTTAFVDRLLGPQGAFAYLPKFRNELKLVVTDLPTQPAAPIREVLREGDLHVTSIAVDHGDVPAVAFRIEHAGHALVVSGDLASKNDNLQRLAAGADLLVYDTAVVDPPGSPKPLYDLHTPPRRIGEVAAAARVKSLLLSHLPPVVHKAKAEVMKSVRASFKGETRFAADCLRIDLLQR
ncbi:MAG: MBL fold metallo-hydrolase [Thermoleophilaceae bacterium]